MIVALPGLFSYLFLTDPVYHYYHLLFGRGSWWLCFSLVCGLCTVYFGLFDVIGRLWSLIVVLPGHLYTNLHDHNLKIDMNLGTS